MLNASESDRRPAPRSEPGVEPLRLAHFAIAQALAVNIDEDADAEEAEDEIRAAVAR